MDETSSTTIYNDSIPCPKCKGIMNPVENLFSGATGLCVRCRNEAYAKQAKSAMSGGR
jgi:uncharacterized paraquat-inducible protein A